MRKIARKAVRAQVPTTFRDPLGLTMRILRSRHPAALLALGSALLGLACTPLDVLLRLREAKVYRNAGPPRWPVLLVCGAPRSATTLVAQVLMKHLPVGFINNLTAVFPRSPITANRLFGKLIGKPRIVYDNFYGKSIGLSGPNDSLHIWDRWLERESATQHLEPEDEADMARFFGAYEAFLDKPIVNKNNMLNSCAPIVARALPSARFICTRRDPVQLAQSLLIARSEIHGDPRAPYGLHDPSRSCGSRSPAAGGAEDGSDPIEDVCAQALYHQGLIGEAEHVLGPERFWVVEYDKFCASPWELVARASHEILGQPVDVEELRQKMTPFEVSNRVRIPPESFERIRSRIESSRAAPGRRAT
ncbi:MAG TPA: sulfotransferase [Planctomycetota bacterium]|nr:sulfotransferase [Planctomycetota bacterium]